MRRVNADEFDSIRDANDLVEFEPGGEVGDREWNLQFLHNASILLERNLKQISPPKTYVILPERAGPEGTVSVRGYFNEHLIDEHSWETICIGMSLMAEYVPRHNDKPIFFLPTGYDVRELSWIARVREKEIPLEVHQMP